LKISRASYRVIALVQSILCNGGGPYSYWIPAFAGMTDVITDGMAAGEEL